MPVIDGFIQVQLFLPSLFIDNVKSDHLYVVWQTNDSTNPVHRLNGAVPGPYVPVQVTRGALVAHRYTYAPPRCRTSQYHMTFIPISVSLWNDLANLVFEGVGLAGFKSMENAFLLAQAALSLLWSSTIFPFLFFLSIGWYCGAGVSDG